MNRREFLAFGASSGTREISCERLYMEFLDALQRGTEERFLEQTFKDLAGARRLRLKESFWLESQALHQAIKPRLERYEAGGGTIELA
jgi:hypothetical protein